MLDGSGGFHVHLVSDSTGETVATVARACLAQFSDARPIQHLWYLVRTPGQVERVLAGVANDPGLVLFTVVDSTVRRALETGCYALGVPCIAVLDPVMSTLTTLLGRGITGRPGGQHVLDAAYYKRMEAIEYTISHDDGQALDDLETADLVLVGVSRTSKTPTCAYLANRGFKAANVPMVLGIDLPEQLATLKSPVIVGLTREPKSLSEIRQNRLRMLNEAETTAYARLESVTEEVGEARRIFARRGWPVIDMTRRSIEEAAATIVELYRSRYPNRGEDG
ncbi:pyruvate, water dikinase regulatory protein [Oleispirillum naphthae]|uniref:pyruvate, water dikinase regulatory protein n=1 Tax=Oleispirillum naphthae TaxID=2838853 RepID=UPI0030822954